MSDLREKARQAHEKWQVGTCDDAETAQEWVMENLPDLLDERDALAARVEELEGKVRDTHGVEGQRFKIGQPVEITSGPFSADWEHEVVLVYAVERDKHNPSQLLYTVDEANGSGLTDGLKQEWLSPARQAIGDHNDED